MAGVGFQSLLRRVQRPGLFHSAQRRLKSRVLSAWTGSFIVASHQEHPSGPNAPWTLPLLTQRITDENDYCLVASLDNVRNLSTVLKAIHFREHATCFATKNGIKVTVENAKCVQANAFIQVWKLAPLIQWHMTFFTQVSEFQGFSFKLEHKILFEFFFSPSNKSFSYDVLQR